MDDKFTQKSLKLLADPYKLKQDNYHPNNDNFKQLLEYKYNYLLDDTIYTYISKEIKTILIIDSILKHIIDQIN
jgi:hypothetical protein